MMDSSLNKEDVFFCEQISPVCLEQSDPYPPSTFSKIKTETKCVSWNCRVIHSQKNIVIQNHLLIRAKRLLTQNNNFDI